MMLQRHGRRPARLLPWQKNLYTIVLAETVAMIGFSIAQPFLPFYVQELGVQTVPETAFWVGMISSLQPICMALSAPFWGMLADRMGRKPMLVRAMIGGAIALVLSGLASTPEQLLVFRLLEGILAGTVAAATTLVAVTTPREHTGYGLGLLQTAMFSGNFIGPLAGGVIASALGYRAAFLISGALLCLAALLVAAIVQETFVRPLPRQQAANPLLSAWRGVFRNPPMITMVLLLTFHNLSVMVTMPVLPLYVQQIVPDIKQATTATGVGATALANAASAILVGRWADRLGRPLVLIGCLVVGALSYLPQGLTQYIWQLLALRVLTGVAMGGIGPVANAIIAEAAPEGGHGAVYGVSSSLNAIGRGAGPAIGVGIVAAAGVGSVFPVTAILLIVVAVVAALRLHSLAAVAPASQ